MLQRDSPFVVNMCLRRAFPFFRTLMLTPMIFNFTLSYLPTLRLLDEVWVFFILPKSPSAEIGISVFWVSTIFFPFSRHHFVFSYIIRARKGLLCPHIGVCRVGPTYAMTTDKAFLPWTNARRSRLCGHRQPKDYSNCRPINNRHTIETD